MAKAETPTREITIQGLTFSVTQPYAEGHTITEAEAKALNQVRAENIRNNMASKIKKALETDGATPESVQATMASEVTEYDAGYEFTLASVGGGRTSTLSPVEREARSIARTYISSQLKEQGITQKEYKEANGEDSINAKIVEFAEHPKIIEMAKKAVAEREANAKVASELKL